MSTKEKKTEEQDREGNTYMNSVADIKGVLNESEVDFLLALFPRRISREGCETDRKMDEPKISWAVTAKTNERERRAVAPAARVVPNPLLRNATMEGGPMVSQNSQSGKKRRRGEPAYQTQG
jgi:hypothetical protein